MLTKAPCCLIFLLLAHPVWAQRPITQSDPRVTGPLIQSLQAQIGLDEAIIKAQREDAGKRETDWAEYSKSLWQLPSVSEAR